MFRQFLYMIYLLVAGALYSQTVYIAPFPGYDPHQLFFNPYADRDEIAKPFCGLREALEQQGYQVKFIQRARDITDASDCVALISFNNTSLGSLESIPLEKRWLLVWEPPVVQPFMYDKALTQRFGKIFVMFDDLVDNVHYFKFYYPQPRQYMMSDIPAFSEKKFCVMISGNKGSGHSHSLYNERVKAINFFEHKCKKEFDLYGSGWQGRKSWKGKIPAKWDVLKQYKFCICYENMKNQNGYITEKIFDVMVAGCIPVYWGASNITSSVPQNCFIDRRRFSSDEELYRFLKTMDEDTYNGYLRAIRHYFASPLAQLYSIDNFVNIILTALRSVE